MPSIVSRSFCVSRGMPNISPAPASSSSYSAGAPLVGMPEGAEACLETYSSSGAPKPSTMVST